MSKILVRPHWLWRRRRRRRSRRTRFRRRRRRFRRRQRMSMRRRSRRRMVYLCSQLALLYSLHIAAQATKSLNALLRNSQSNPNCSNSIIYRKRDYFLFLPFSKADTQVIRVYATRFEAYSVCLSFISNKNDSKDFGRLSMPQISMAYMTNGLQN